MVGYSDPSFDGVPEGKVEGRRTSDGWIDGMVGMEERTMDGDVEEAMEGILD